MARQFTLGIDLGTSNSALAYLDLKAEEPQTQVLLVPQLQSLAAVQSEAILPSFLYLPSEEELKSAADLPFDTREIVGTLAREQSALTPGRVVASAKSWLCHGGVDRETPILPWGSSEIPPASRLSPVEVSSLYLKHLKQAWERAFPEAPFDKQEITITVPASFDEVAQLLTLRAASLAGYPPTVRLMEEPQSAFYFWLENHRSEEHVVKAWLETLPGLAVRPQRRLVADIGGGTTDFSLFDISPPEGIKRPEIRRIAVSDHLLLGGDNLDLTIARQLEMKLEANGSKLSARQFALLASLSRGLKERVLSDESGGADDEVFHVSRPGEGSSLFKTTLTAELTRREVKALVTDGFFPLVAKTDRPRRAEGGFKEWGLPFVADTAVTRHLAAFLAGREVDALLLNGGTLKPTFLQERLASQLEIWQGRRPAVLENPEMDLAVAKGAAYYGAILKRPSGKIRGGYAHSIYAELYQEDAAALPELVCLLPKGFEPGDKLKLKHLGFKLLVDRPVRFQLYYSNRREDEAGSIVALNADDFQTLPPLQTKLTLPEGAPRPRDGFLDVTLEARLGETGMLQLFCVGGKERWQLDFNLRRTEEPREVAAPQETGVAPARLEKALERVDLFYGKKKIADLDDSPKNLKRELEKILGLPREKWSLALCRALWPALAPGATRRVRSPAHEVTWLYLAGFCLRPGYGAELDNFRMEELWRCFPVGLAHPKHPAASQQWWILWRRVAGGLDTEKQHELGGKLMNHIRAKSDVMPEMVLCAGSLERMEAEWKAELGDLIVRRLVQKRVTAIEPHLWTLGRLSARVPLYAGAQAAVSPSHVVQWIEQLLTIDLRTKGYQNVSLFLSQAARLTGDRNRDLPDNLREAVLDRMRSLGAQQEQCEVVERLVEVDKGAQAKLFGEDLPSGLKLVGI
jgi:molecular chaperone DnaK (HSP70)